MQNNFLLKKIFNVYKYLLVPLTWNQMFILMNDYCEQMYLVLWSWMHAKSCQCVQIDIGDCMHGK